MVMRCPRQSSPCFAIECNGLGACWQEQLEAEQQQMSDMRKKMARMCPTLGIYCYLKQCVENDHCDQIERDKAKAAAAVNSVLGPIGSDPQDATSTVAETRNKAHSVAASMGSKATTWTCPEDKQPCSMISCNGGKTCYVESQRGKPTGSSMTGYSNGSYKHVPPCHEGMHSLGFINKAEIMVGREGAARNWDQEKDGKIGLIIGLLGDAFPQGNVVNMNEQAKALGSASLNVLTPIIPNIWIRWPDFGVVHMSEIWWKHLLNVIAQVDGAVLIYCMGGHGRTGTAAAILCSLAGLVPESADPVAWVRAKYCEKVVESDGQVQYIEKITGRKVHCFASKDTSYSAWSTYEQGSGATYVPKKKSYHGSGTGYKPKGPKNNGDPNRLSKRKWKAWWRKRCLDPEYHAIASITRPAQIPDGQIFTVGKRDWRWSVSKDEFEEVAQAEKKS